ncbi:MAG: biotin transporter BioY [Clostridiales bacterium]|nr:biotin transporter BioY [Clostridiales bacterium]
MSDKNGNNKAFNRRNSVFGTYNMVLEAICAALIAICSWISIPFGQIPFTLQTMAVFIVLMTIGGKRGLVSIICYLLLGAIGVPVFAGFKGGFAVLLGPTGGFLVGFIAVALLYRLLSEKVFGRFMTSYGKRLVFNIVIAIICEIVMYAIGVVWFMAVYTPDTGRAGLTLALTVCCFPYLIPDLIKLVLASLISSKGYSLVRR